MKALFAAAAGGRLMHLRVEVVAEVRLALEGTAAVGAPKVHVAIVLLKLRVGLQWLR